MVRAKRLLVSVHDVSPAHWKEVADLVDAVRSAGIDRFSMLVVPRYHGEYHLGRYPDFCGWLADLAGEGAEMVLHGLTHEEVRPAAGALDGIRAALFTRGEGEFLGLGCREATARLEEGKCIMEDCLGVSPYAFVAPAWLYGAGTMDALKQTGFRVAESRWRIWSPSLGMTMTRMPVANYVHGRPLKELAALFWVRMYRHLARGKSTVRLALHPSDAKDSDSLRNVVGLIEELARDRERFVMSDFLPDHITAPSS